jgi:benzoyl-CoA reductase/2-hydroxyglutaryl-CoA dehydratase subunit BcrC/BadD/HgdB
MIEVLKEIVNDLKEQKKQQVSNKPRLLLIGPNLACGDYKVLDVIDAAGGEVVIEEITEGLRNYWQNIEIKEAPITALAEGYLRDRAPCAFMVNTSKKRRDFALKLIEDFGADEQYGMN